MLEYIDEITDMGIDVPVQKSSEGKGFLTKSDTERLTRMRDSDREEYAYLETLAETITDSFEWLYYKQKIEKLFQSGDVLYYSDIASKLQIDIRKVVSICKELLLEGRIHVDKGQ